MRISQSAEMNFDTYIPFGVIHTSGEEFTTQLLDVSKRTILREDTQIWARNLRFLCVSRDVAPCAAASNSTTSKFQMQLLRRDWGGVLKPSRTRG